MGEGPNKFLARAKAYGYALKVALSLVAFSALHLAVFRETLLGPLSALADATFYLDVSADLIFFLVLSTVASRVAVLAAFSGAVDDSFRVVRRTLSWLPGTRKILQKLDDAGLNYGNFLEVVKRRLTPIEILISVPIFFLLYCGGALTIGTLPVLMASLVIVVFVGMQIFSNAGVLDEEFSWERLARSPLKFAIVVSFLSVLVLAFSAISGVLRAHSIVGNNVVSVNVSGFDSPLCATILGKTASGVFIQEYFYAEENFIAPFFVSYSDLKVVALGGSEFFWMKRPEELSCAEGEMFFSSRRQGEDVDGQSLSEP